MDNLLVKGIIIGFSIAAPVGPIGILCIRKTLAGGRMFGLSAGLGAATADMIYGMIAVSGLTWLMAGLLDYQSWLRVGGGIFLCYLAVTTFNGRPGSDAAGVEGTSLLRTYFSTFVLTLTNPMTILSFAGVFAGLGFGAATGNSGMLAMVIGVFLGSVCWWLILSNAVALLGRHLSTDWMIRINWLAGTCLGVFGLFAILSPWM